MQKIGGWEVSWRLAKSWSILPLGVLLNDPVLGLQTM